jgi:predicted nucleic acid-binding protein
VESSAYVKAFSKEKGSEYVTTILDHANKGNLEAITSQWTIGESLAAVDRNYRRKEIKLNERETIVATLMERTMDLVSKGKLMMVYTKQDLVSSSWRLIAERHLSADDALHLFAIVGLCDAFISSDAYLLEAAKQVGFDSYNMEDSAEFRRLTAKLRLE